MTTFLCQGNFSTFQKIKLVLLIGHWLFVIFKTTFTESRRIIKSRIPGRTITYQSSSHVSKCNPELRLLNKQNRWSRKAVEDLLESCTSSVTCFIYVLIKSSNIWFDTEVPPHPFVYHFWKRRYIFCIPSIEKWCTLHIPSREIYLLYIWTNRKTRTAFSRLFHSHKMRQLALLGLFTNRNDKSYPTLSYIWIIEFPALFIYLSGDWGFSPYRQL